MMKKNSYLIKRLLPCILAVGLCGCTVYDTPPPVEGDKPEEGLSLDVQKKVLWINIDGAVGEIVRDHCPPRLAAMLEHSKYSWGGLGDLRGFKIPLQYEDPVNWTSMLTGVSRFKHNVGSYSYLPDLDPDPENPNAAVKVYPNVITRIKDVYPMARTVCITPWSRLNLNQLVNASDVVTTQTDEETFEKASAYLHESDPMLMILSFTGMQQAGTEGGFKAGNASYLQALNTIDDYIGGLLDSLPNRANAFFEDWLVIVSSGYGGNPDGDYSEMTEQSRNTFGMFYFPYYGKDEIKGEKFYAAFLDLQTLGEVVDTLDKQNPRFSPYKNRQFTQQMIMRVDARSDGTFSQGGSWPSVIEKSGYWRIQMQHALTVSPVLELGNGLQIRHNAGSQFMDLLWHSHIINLDQSELPVGNVKYSFYYDANPFEGPGKYTDARSIDLVDSVNLVLGDTRFRLTRHIAALRIWDKTLSAEEINRYAGTVTISEDDENYPHLLGYWLFSPEYYDPEKKSVKNLIDNGRTDNKQDMIFKESIDFYQFANSLPAKNSDNLVFENTLFVPQILYWLGIAKPTDLDAPVILDRYSEAEEWREAEQDK